MLDIIDSINESVLADNHVLVNFKMVNMLPNVENKSGLKSVKDALCDSNFYLDSVQYIVDALEICLTCKNSKFNHQHFLQTDGMAQGPHMSCSYVDIAIAKYDFLANKFYLTPFLWKRFRGNVFLLLEHGMASFPLFLDYLNSMDKTVKATLVRKFQVKQA